MNILNLPIVQIIIEIIIFTLLAIIGRFIFEKLKNSSSRYSNPDEFLPEDEVHTLKQVFYLIMMALSFINLLYSFVTVGTSIFYFSIFDLFVSLVIAIDLDKSSNKNWIILLLLVPYGSLTFLLFNFSIVAFLDWVHVVIFLYFMMVYYNKFNDYTRFNNLGTTVLLLFVIIFISFFITQIVEHVNPLDSMVMVSNAFTSNGYSILGNSILGKINSLLLVWGGYIISGVGTATLSSAILIKYFNKRVKQLERIIEEGSDE